jgi:hypothetical protein
VAILVDDEEVYRKGGVTTRTQISLADSLRVDAPAGPVRLHVDVPSQGVRETVEATRASSPSSDSRSATAASTCGSRSGSAISERRL